MRGRFGAARERQDPSPARDTPHPPRAINYSTQNKAALGQRDHPQESWRETCRRVQSSLVVRTPGRGRSAFTVSQGKDQLASLIKSFHLSSARHPPNFNLATSAPAGGFILTRDPTELCQRSLRVLPLTLLRACLPCAPLHTHPAQCTHWLLHARLHTHPALCVSLLLRARLHGAHVHTHPAHVHTHPALCPHLLLYACSHCAHPPHSAQPPCSVCPHAAHSLRSLHADSALCVLQICPNTHVLLLFSHF